MTTPPPPLLNISCTDYGIRFGKRFFKYSDIQDFWLYFEPEEHHYMLHFRLRTSLFGDIGIPFPSDMAPDRLRDVLLGCLPERKGYDEPFVDRLIRHLGL